MDIIDKPLLKIAISLREHASNLKTFKEYFDEFDSDYDGKLT